MVKPPSSTDSSARQHNAAGYEHTSIEDLNRLESEWESRAIPGTSPT